LRAIVPASILARMRRLILAIALLPLAFGSGARAQFNEPHVFNLILENGRAAPAPPTMRTYQGQRVHIGFHSDRPMELHLHGYDVLMPVAPGASYNLRFDVTQLGTFTIDAHEPNGSHRTVAILIVNPF
jgi:hypothetical protein